VKWRKYGDPAEVVWQWADRPSHLQLREADRAFDDETAALGADGWEMLQVDDDLRLTVPSTARYSATCGCAATQTRREIRSLDAKCGPDQRKRLPRANWQGRELMSRD
jgi:hypothetical protein